MRTPIRKLILNALAIVLAAMASGCFGTSNAPNNVGVDGGDSTQGPKEDDNLPIDLVPTKTEDPPPTVEPRFPDVAAERGVEFQFHNDIVPKRFFLPEIMGGGAAWIDFDLDGWHDLYLQNGDHLVPKGDEPPINNRLLRNVAGQFEDVAIAANAGCGRGYGQGCAVGDFNADGFPDLFLSNYGPNVLLLNNGDGTFSDASETAGIDDSRWGSSCVATDLNNDGLLDIYLANYTNTTIENTPKEKVYDQGIVGYAGPGDFEAETDCVYLNRGDGTFEEASERLNMVGVNGKGLAVVAMDFDDDGQVEIYVANDMDGNYLFTRSEVSGVKSADNKPWRNVAVAVGCAVSENGKNEASMGISCGDFDGDGLPDIFLTHFANSKSTLYRNLGGLYFEDFSNDSQIAKISHKTLGFGTVALDYDRNGAPDIFVTNGNVLGPAADPNEMPPQFFLNEGRGRFRDISDFAGDYFDGAYLGRGAAGGDFDNDGDLDILVTHVVKPYALLENQTEAPGTWIGFDAQRVGRACLHGAVVSIEGPGGKTSAQFIAGGSYLCSPDHRVLLSIPEAAESVNVTIRWPGQDQPIELGELRTGRYWRIMEGEEPTEF